VAVEKCDITTAERSGARAYNASKAEVKTSSVGGYMALFVGFVEFYRNMKTAMTRIQLWKQEVSDIFECWSDIQ